MSSITYREQTDGGIWYNLSFGTVTIYYDYLIWGEGTFHQAETHINYSDIISVSASDGGFFGNAFIQLNTAGRTYTISSLGKVNGFYRLKEIIEEKISLAKKKAASNSNTISAADEIAKYKELANQGVISQAEFEAKKKQLLGL